MTSGAEDRGGRHYRTERDAGWPQVSAPTCELVDCDAVEDVKGRVQLERLAASLAHKADLHGRARRLGNLHRKLPAGMR